VSNNIVAHAQQHCKGINALAAYTTTVPASLHTKSDNCTLHTKSDNCGNVYTHTTNGHEASTCAVLLRVVQRCCTLEDINITSTSS
jgi:hypothetical protein